jgi:hypothetical protein
MPRWFPRLQRWQMALAVCLVLGGGLWWWVRSHSFPADSAFTAVCPTSPCPDEDAIFALVRAEYGPFMPFNEAIAEIPTGIGVYRPRFTADYKYAVVGFSRLSNGYCEQMLLDFERTRTGWQRASTNRLGIVSYGCGFR